MTISKLRIDLSQGIIEAEGSDTFVLQVYEDFKNRIPARLPENNSLHNPSQTAAFASNPQKEKSVTIQKPKRKTTLPNIVTELDLSGGGKIQRLKEFFATYEVKSNYERNLIFVYYLKHLMKVDGITVDHVFTCYRDVGAKIPSLRQSLQDTSFHRGWIETTNMEDITLTTPGINFLEHDLQKKA